MPVSLRDIRFVVHEVLDFAGHYAALDPAPAAVSDRAFIDAVIEEAHRFSTQELEPLNAGGDREGCRWQDGTVSTPSGFKAAYATDAPAGTRGISMFVVPRLLPDGSRNGVECLGIEHKMGIHGNAACTMSFDGAAGHLVGEPNRGMRYMFTMMNAARLVVGLQGVCGAHAACLTSMAYAAGKLAVADFYFARMLPRRTAHRLAIEAGPDTLLGPAAEVITAL